MKTTVITSSQNAVFRQLRSLTTSSGLKEHSQFFLMGRDLIREHIGRGGPYAAVVSSAENDHLRRELRIEADVDHWQLSNDLFREVDVIGTHAPILVLEQPELPVWKIQDEQQLKGLTVVLPLGDPGNLGAAIRSCAAFGANRIVVTREASHPYLPKVTKGSAGANTLLPIFKTDALAKLPEFLNVLDSKVGVVALGKSARPISAYQWPPQAILIVGEEGPGLPPAFFNNSKLNVLEIPMDSKVESLNAVVALSIALASRSVLKLY